MRLYCHKKKEINTGVEVETPMQLYCHKKKEIYKAHNLIQYKEQNM